MTATHRAVPIPKPQQLKRIARARPIWIARFALMRSLASLWKSLAHRLAWPYVELLIRLWIAKLFSSFGVQELMHWAAALQIANEQNPFPRKGVSHTEIYFHSDGHCMWG
jgi:hypothetical protein